MYSVSVSLSLGGEAASDNRCTKRKVLERLLLDRRGVLNATAIHDGNPVAGFDKHHRTIAKQHVSTIMIVIGGGLVCDDLAGIFEALIHIHRRDIDIRYFPERIARGRADQRVLGNHTSIKEQIEFRRVFVLVL